MSYYLDTVYYTHSQFATGSSWIPEIYYNENDQTLFLNLDTNSGDVIWQYEDVPADVWQGLEDADSKGTFYNTRIKPYYSGVYFADYDDLRFEEVGVRAAQPVSVGAAANVTSSFPASNYVSLHTADPAESVAIPTTGAGKTEGYISLATSNTGLRKFTVDFLVGEESKSHTLYEQDWNMAVAAVEQVGEMVGVEFKVIGVTLGG